MIKRRLQPAGRHRSKPHPGKSCNTNCAPRPGTPFTKCARPSSNRSSARSRNNEASAASACADWRRCAPNGSWCAQPPTCSSSSAPVGHRKQPEMRRRILFGSPRWPTWQTRSKRSGGPCTPTKDLNRAPKIAIPDNLLGVTAGPQIRSLAVLPLDNLSGDPAQDYFADGMTDELITMLAKNSTLSVTSRTSVMQYKGAHRPLPQIARELGVDAILEGSVSRSGDQVHMTIQL